jgi:hypothetical protein
MLVAEVRIGLPGTSPPEGFAVLRWDDPIVRKEAARLLTNAVGPIARSPQSSIGAGLMLRRPEEVQVVRSFLQCQTAPTEKALEEFLPDAILHVNADLSERVLRFESDGKDSYRVTMPVLVRAADYLVWSDGLKPQFDLIRGSLNRPSARVLGYYGNPDRVPIPNFRSSRNLVQTLGARAQCHLLLDQPEEALTDLTLIQNFSQRIFEQSKPMTLLSAMLNVGVTGMYSAQIGEGLRLKAWREPQLAALEEQLKSIDALTPVKEAFTIEATMTFNVLDSVPSAGLVKRSTLKGLAPRGWGYQHSVSRVELEFGFLDTFDTANQIVFADKVEAVSKRAQEIEHESPYTFVPKLETPNFVRVSQVAAHSQTEVNQALIACALERYHLARGEYPAELDALVPQFLDKIPNDVLSGRPFHYRRADGEFILYSVGWNGRDDGGVRGHSSASGDGDWVWPD